MTSSALPLLARQHPGYFKVLCSLIFVHLALAVDSVFAPLGKTPAYVIIGQMLHQHYYLLAVAHLAIGVLMIYGLYGRFQAVRLGSALSAFTFNALAVGLAFGEVLQGLSFLPAICCVALSLSSVAAVREPRDGPRGVLT